MVKVDLYKSEIMDLLYSLRTIREELPFDKMEEYAHYCAIENKICAQLMQTTEGDNNGIPKENTEQRREGSCPSTVH